MTVPLLTLGGLSLPTVGDYTLDGPHTATVGVVSDQFVVTLGAGTLFAPVNITPHRSGAAGTFTVAFVTLSDGSRSASFRFTSSAAGSVTISVTNDGGLTDPPSITLLASSAPAPPALGGSPIVMLNPAATGWYRRG